MPNLVEARLPDPEPLSGIHFNAANALGSLGKDARAAVPSLIRLSKESNQADVRLSAIMALHRIDPKDSQVREALMTATHDTNSAVRTQAQMLLNTFDIFAPSAGF
jgi:HEAT repeat protein